MRNMQRQNYKQSLSEKCYAMSVERIYYEQIKSFEETIKLIKNQIQSSYQPLTRLENIKQILDQHIKELQVKELQEDSTCPLCDGHLVAISMAHRIICDGGQRHEFLSVDEARKINEKENQDLKDTIEKIEKLNRGYDSDLPIGYKINMKELLSDNLEFDNAEQAEKYLLDKLSDKGEKV